MMTPRTYPFAPLALLAALGLAACGARDDQGPAFPEPGETVAFAMIHVAGMRASTFAIREVDQTGAAAGTVTRVRAGQGTQTHAFFLQPGQYAVAGVRDPDAAAGGGAAGGTLVFELAPGKASYIGTFEMLIESGRFCAVDLGDDAFAAAAADFRKRFPALAARFEIANAVARTDRIEATVDGDAGAEP